ncbi:MAG: trypsin-like serine peptidase [Maricaulaceae bacterium]
MNKRVWQGSVSAVAAILAAAHAQCAELRVIDFAQGVETVLAAPETLTEARPASVGARGGDPITLPQTAPTLPVRGSELSPLMRARDVFDLSAFPARAVAKLHRLNADGKRAVNACTAQFIGPKHLLTAAHCLVDVGTGDAHAGFELAIEFDAGETPIDPVPVQTAWLPADAFPSVQFGPDAPCVDWAVIEISNPLGADLGWFGLRADLPRDEDSLVHRFSYPNRRASELTEPPNVLIAPSQRVIAAEGRTAETLDALTQPQPGRIAIRLPSEFDLNDPAVQAALAQARTQIAETSQPHEPDFSLDNLYFEYGAVGSISEQTLEYARAFNLAGQSGSGFITEDYAIVGVLSRGAGGRSISCRVSPELMGLVGALRAP